MKNFLSLMGSGRCLQILLALALLAWLGGNASPSDAKNPASPEKKSENKLDNEHPAKMAKGLEIFKKQVRPVLQKSCFQCHGGKKVESDLDLTDRKALLRGGESGPAILPGNAKDSLLFKLITHAKKPHMPHERPKLPAEAIAAIAAWIDAGAPYDKPLTGKPEAASWTQTAVPDDARKFWSFQPLQRFEAPKVRNAGWCRTPVDRFILAHMEAAGLQPNPPVDRRQLIRRAYFDLIGLPPTPEEVDAFLNDATSGAYEKLLDRLLTSPHYGERWARHWLDVVRFAESHGFEHDYDRPTAYHYRDSVIQALNEDLAYDTFVKWQLAGDELAPESHLALKATGFLAAGVHSTQITIREVERHRYDEMDDMLATTGTAMLGLTIGCARCHDHKFDPIPQADYYRLVSTFTTTVRTEVDMDLDPERHKKAQAAYEKKHTPLVASLQKFDAEQLPGRLEGWEKAWSTKPTADLQGVKIPDPILSILKTAAGKRTPEQAKALLDWYRSADPERRQLDHKVQEHAKKAPQLPKVLISSEGLPALRLHTQGADFMNETYFLRRGDPDQKEGVAPQSFLQALMAAPEREKHWQTPPPKGWRTSYRRKALAAWLTDVDQGAGRLLARVIVNRLWQHHMGRGLVSTPSDFGTRGERPTHPELLDWLALELIRNGWHLKPIHKLIMSSAVFMQSSQRDEMKARIDNENRWFWHRPRHRLEAEAIRDSLLAVSGTLDKTMYGPGTLAEGSKRRSIYFTVKRSKIVPMMQVFDAPDALVSIGERPTTTIAPQALFLMNNPHVRGYAKGFARRIAPDEKTPLAEAINNAYRIAFARLPSAEELENSQAFVQKQMESYKANGKGDGRDLALADFCQTLMCLNEFVYIE